MYSIKRACTCCCTRYGQGHVPLLVVVESIVTMEELALVLHGCHRGGSNCMNYGAYRIG